jgi:hypothetical protein
MKKVLIFGALIGVAYLAFGNNKREAAPTSSDSILPGNEIDNLIDYSKPENLFADFNNQIVVDVNGFWTVVENGTIRPANDSDLSKYPNVTVGFDLWKYYIVNFSKLIAA